MLLASLIPQYIANSVPALLPRLSVTSLRSTDRSFANLNSSSMRSLHSMSVTFFPCDQPASGSHSKPVNNRMPQTVNRKIVIVPPLYPPGVMQYNHGRES